MSTYGYFDDAAREYVIMRPDTPLPWLNYLGQEDFFGLCTNTGGGYSFWRDAKLRRLTRYRYNNVPSDLGGRYVYVRDETGPDPVVWNPGWKPTKTALDDYACHVGLGYTDIVGAKDGVRVSQRMFVPPGENAEIWQVRVRNESARPRELRLYSFVEFAFYDAQNDATNLQRTMSIGEVQVEGSAIYHVTEYRERRDHYTLFGCTRDIAGFDTSREAFVGVHEGFHEARVPFAGRATNSLAQGWNPVGSHEVALSLAPGESIEVAFVLAYLEQPEPKFVESATGPHVNTSAGDSIMSAYREPGAVDAAFARLRSYWDERLSAFQGKTPDEHASRMLNTWNQYQCMATFNLSRSASLFETGIGRGMGFRDSNQDLLGFVHMIPQRARQRILDIAATQLSDGTCFHQYQPLTKQGNADVGGDFYDDHLWLVLSTTAYIRETGDVSLLDEPCGYADVPVPDGETPASTLLDHLEVSIAYTLAKRGPHDLPLIGHADWNDCLNLNCFSTEPNESFQLAGDVEGSQAESVMIAGLFLYAAREMVRLYEHVERPDDAKRMLAGYDDMLAVVETQAWDGEWYTRAFDATGSPVGSHVNDEGRLYIESQGWAVLGGAGLTNGRARRALESVGEQLATENGIVLQQPAYTRYHLELGEITSYPPGVKENAGIFCHNNSWIHLAHCVLGDGDRAFEYYLSVCPSAKQSQIDTYRLEPYVYAQTIDGKDSPTFGQAKNSWLTGTAAWTFVVLTQGILGIKPDYDGLRIDPCIPTSWDGFEVTRRFRGSTFHITVTNPDGVSTGVRAVTMDGAVVEGTTLQVPSTPSHVEVEVVLG
ncbi:MAG: glycosyl hydrolase family 65 protein [Jiangellales bacterium]